MQDDFNSPAPIMTVKPDGTKEWHLPRKYYPRTAMFITRAR